MDATGSVRQAICTPLSRLRPMFRLHDCRNSPFVSALSVCEMARELTGLGDQVRCKWPNDVLAGDAKLCGILLETAALPDGRYAVISGIGVNVASSPPDTPYPATSLGALGFRASSDDVLIELAKQMGYWISVWAADGFGAVRSAWLQRVSGLGEPIIARLPDREIQGRFVGMAEDGALMLETGAGTCYASRRRTCSAPDS